MLSILVWPNVITLNGIYCIDEMVIVLGARWLTLSTVVCQGGDCRVADPQREERLLEQVHGRSQETLPIF